MATGGDIYPPGTILGFRLMGLIIDEGTPLLRTLFNREVSRMAPRGKSLQEHLRNHRDNLFELLNPDQQKIVYPSTGVANSSKDFDISLLCLLLERLCNTQHMALIHQLRKFRNKNHGHITGTALSKRKFGELWKELSDILLGLGRLVKTEAEIRKLESRLLERKEIPIDGEQATKYREQFEDFHRQDNNLKTLIIDKEKKVCSLIEEGHQQAQRQTSQLKMMAKELRYMKSAQGKQHKQGMDKVEEAQNALETKLDQQRHSLTEEVAGLNKTLQAITAEQQKQSTGMKTTGRETMEKLDELKDRIDELKTQPTCTSRDGQNTVAETQNVRGEKGTIDKLRNNLQGRYRRELARVRPLPWCEDFYMNLEDMFTTLEMVRRDGLKVDTAVIAEHMFQSHNGESDPKTIRVEGNPGIGKTTLCYKIIYDCSAVESKFVAQNKFSSFKLVLYVEMRQVPHDATDVKSTIFKQVFPKAYYKHEAEFWDYVESNPEDVLFVLDGLDEMPEGTREQLEMAEFIRGQIIPDVCVIVTSRPYLCNTELASCHRHFVVKGYSQENIKSYIHKHQKLEPNSKEAMLKQLNENENLHQLTQNPLNLALLCILWQQDWNNAILPQTLTSLYSLLVLAIVKRCSKKCLGISDVFNSKLEEMPEPIEGKLNQLSHLALNGIKEDRLNFSGETVESLVEIGFLTKDLNLTTAIQQPFWFQFLHKTFQEYFAARHLHSLCVTSNGEQSSKVSDILNECVQNDRYQQVLKFLAGFLRINARCLFEAFRDYLSTNQDDRTVSLCLECLHECGAGTELARYVSDVLPRDWKLSSYGKILQWIEFPDEISHFHPLRNMFMYLEEPNVLAIWPSLPSDCFGMYFLSCYTNLISVTAEMLEKGHYIITNEALYGLVCLLHYLAKTNTGEDNNTLLSNVLLQPGVENAACRFLNAISDIKGIRCLAMTMADHHDSTSTEIVYQSSKNDGHPCKLSLYPCKSSTLNHMDNVLSLVQGQTQLSLATCSSLKLDANFNINSTDRSTLCRVINTIIRLGTEGGRDRAASVGLHIHCTAEMYIPEFVSFSIENLVTTLKVCQTQSSCPQGRLGLGVIVKNLPLAEKPMVQSHLAELLPILQHSYCIISSMIFECSCEDDSVVSTIPLLESLTLNQSLTEVSFLSDDPENVVRCLRDIFAENRTLQELEIGFLHPVEDETMAKIFRSYPIDNQCQITSFSVLMETGLTPPQTQTAVTKSCNNNHLSYEQTVNAILNICKNLCDGSTLQKISFRTGPGYAMTKTGCPLNCVLKVTPFCPGSLLKPLADGILDSRLIVNLAGITWLNIDDLRFTDEFFKVLAWQVKQLRKLEERLQELHCLIASITDQTQKRKLQHVIITFNWKSWIMT
ncbi:uncharacterized protein LOC144923886 [Branchiostoma floridae x Branchiostoma belcheri]